MKATKRAGWLGLAMPIVILASILLIYLPLPGPVLDVFLAANLAASVLILLTAVFVRSPLEFSLFPSLLLITTLSRIALNVATTRLILARGPIDGELAAGQVVRSFGEFVAGDQLAVGLVIFLILFIVQFMVITSGTTRIGEVAARFALDGLPGRQMAIDADLNAGVISHEQAHQERKRLLASAEFYGSMDGASKYVRGDAMAGLCITFINLAGGIAFGLSQGMGFPDAVGTFSKLTIGDGLCSQLPALMISLAAGLLVSRGSAETSFPEASMGQLTSRPIAMILTAGLLLVFLLAKMPALPMIGLAAVLAGLAWFSGGAGTGSNQRAAGEIGGSGTAAPAERSMERLLEANPLQLELGMGLLPLAESAKGGELLARISLLRQEIASRSGLVMPKVRVCDNLQVNSSEFRILLDEIPVLQARIPAGSVLQLGAKAVDRQSPATAPNGLPWANSAVWVQRELVSLVGGGTTLEPVEVIVRSLDWAVRANAAGLLTLDALQLLLEETRRQHPVLVEEAIGCRASLTAMHWIFRELAGEGMPLRPMHQILESLLEAKRQKLDDEKTVALCRRAVSRNLCRQLCDPNGRLACFGLSKELERRIAAAQSSPQSGVYQPLQFSGSLIRSVETGIRHMLSAGLQPVMVVRSDIRRAVASILKSLRPSMHLLGEDEVEGVAGLEMIARIRLGDLPESAGAAA